MTLLILLATPLAAALASLAARKKLVMLEITAALAALVEFGCVMGIIATTFSSGSDRYGSFLAVDSLSAVILITVALVGLGASFYSIGYLREEVRKQIIGFKRVRQYYVLLHLFLMAMFFAILTSSPIGMWIAIEATTLSTAFLISFYNKPSSMEAAWKYLIINSIGLLLGFFGTLLFLASTANAGVDQFISWGALTGSAATMNPMLAKIAFIFVLIGYGTKVGLAPMHTWLPDAHSKAPSPISALLSGSLLNVAMLAVLKFKIVADTAGASAFSQDLMIYFGVGSLVIAAFIILGQKNYKRLFAYSSIEHMGIVAIGVGFGGLGTFAALLHMVYHSLVKSALFFSAGNIFLKYSSTKIAKVRGILTTLPVTGVILLVGFLAITGMPPFGIFITEIYILSAGVAGHLPIVLAVLLLLVLVFAGFLRHIVAMAFDRQSEPLPAGETSFFTIAPAILLLAVFITAGFYLPAPLERFVTLASSMING